MRIAHTLVALGGAVAGFAFLSAAVVVGCSGDGINLDAGPDTGLDGPATDAGPDVQPRDSGPDIQSGDGGDPVEGFRNQLAVSVCTRLQLCCGGPSNFDYVACTQNIYSRGWDFSHYGMTHPGVKGGGRVKLDSAKASQCLAGLSTLSCPVLTSAEHKNILANCFGAIVGTQVPSAPCNASLECEPGNYCNIPAEAGVPDGGSIGACAQLLDSGVQCGQQPYQSYYYSSEQCAYNSGANPPRFCNYDAPQSANWFCAPLRADNQPCYTDNECLSQICNDVGGGNYQCVTSANIGAFICPAFKIKDAGPG